MKSIYSILIALLFINVSFAQEITLDKNVFGYKFEQNGEQLSWKELINKTESNVEANLFLKEARTNNTISKVLAFVGGGLIGIPIGQSIAGDDANWTLAYVGGGIAIMSFPIASKASKDAKQGIELYNASLNTTAAFSPEFKIIASGNGIGLSMNF
ncbi:hypothetical protein [Sediminibacter sp. Hel_I_10]|uniref:hypothetical protein n=1 Tax=Sediminibacter sp. Hel_I_10 TaxID=1392490 RepID=UPI00047A117F|nr:hypothetical protein [Sediminibacter sp. Hel_I_10]